MYLSFIIYSSATLPRAGRQILEQKVVCRLHSSPPALVHLPKEIKQMVRALHHGDAGVDALPYEARVRALALLPRDQVVGRAVDEKRRRRVAPARDLRGGADAGYGCG